MSLKERINKLEETISKTYVDADLETELIEWFKSHPGYIVWLGPEDNNGLFMPEHLSQTFGCILNRALANSTFKSGGSRLVEVLDSLSETFKGHAIF